MGTKKVKWICRWCLLRSNSSWVFSSFFVFFHYTSVINSSEDKISCWGNLTSFASKDRHLFCSLLLVKKFHESLVPMQGVWTWNVELTLGLIQVGFVSSKVFPGNMGKTCFFFDYWRPHMLIGQSEPVVPIGPWWMNGWLVVMKQFSVGFNFPSQPWW